MTRRFCDLSRNPSISLAELLATARAHDITAFPLTPDDENLVEAAEEIGIEGVLTFAGTWGAHPLINVHFDGGSAADQQRVMQVAAIWERNVDVFFTYDRTKASDLRVRFDPNDGNWSALGTSAKTPSFQGRPTMNLANRDAAGVLTADTILHEFGHALGFYHEHQHPRIALRWNDAQVISDLSGPPNNWSADKVRAQVLTRLSERGKVFGTYDSASIMHYDVPASWHGGGFAIGPNVSLSAEDIVRAKASYPDARSLAVLDRWCTSGSAPRPRPGFESFARLDVGGSERSELLVAGDDLTVAVSASERPGVATNWGRSENGLVKLKLGPAANSHLVRVRADRPSAAIAIHFALDGHDLVAAAQAEPYQYKLLPGDRAELVALSVSDGIFHVTFGDPTNVSGYLRPYQGQVIDLNAHFTPGVNQINLRHISNDGPFSVSYELRINGAPAAGSPFTASGAAGFLNKLHRVAELVFRVKV